MFLPVCVIRVVRKNRIVLYYRRCAFKTRVLDCTIGFTTVFLVFFFIPSADDFSIRQSVRVFRKHRGSRVWCIGVWARSFHPGSVEIFSIIGEKRRKRGFFIVEFFLILL